MLRLNPEGYLRFLQADRFMVNYTGAEANVCVSLAMMGMDTDFVTRLPENDIAAAGVAQLRKFGVGTGHIAYGGERMGVFYVEKGASQGPSKVVYDRKYSSIAQCAYEDFDWEAIFAGASNFHMTGITPALSKTIPQVCIQACKKAKEMGLTGDAAANFVETMNTWNASVAAGEDAEFGRSNGMDGDLSTAPYYAIKIAPGIHHTMGGLKINTDAQVLDTDGSIIPGLYAAGETTGGVHGGNRIGGNAVCDFVVFGRIAGSNASAYAAA